MKYNYIFIALILITSCSNDSRKDKTDTYSRVSSADVEESSDGSNCGIEDGTHSASVDYNNPETGYAQNYNLDVEVEDCQVIQINFSNGGWLDEDHITAADLDADGTATVDGEECKTYEVHIED
jgi:hypothetical protein